jgi:hypothetical protein
MSHHGREYEDDNRNCQTPTRKSSPEMTTSSPHRTAATPATRNDSPFPPYPPLPLWRRALAAASAFRRRHHVLTVTKDGGPESTVWAHWLFEFKGLASVVVLRFENGSRDAYHNHAFDCVSWVLAGGGLVEHRIGGPGANLEQPYLFLPSPLPILTRRAHLHKVISCGRTWVLSVRGPWQDNWQEVVPTGAGNGGTRCVELTHGRKEVRA